MGKKRVWEGIGAVILSAMAAMALSMTAWAATYDEIWGPGTKPGDYVASLTEGTADIYVSMDSYDILRVAKPGETYDILGDEGSGWMEISVGDGVGYVSAEQVSIITGEEAQAIRQDEEIQASVKAEEAKKLRQHVVDYALQFLGCRYVAGGNDPHTGVDCSGFVRYVMQNAAGVSLLRSSGSQATQGITISADQMQPGDLIFYGDGGRVSHVAMYIGNGQIVHASTYKTGVKISKWNYKTPLRIANMLGV